ncbi:MAG: SDR family oxidoreductase [Deltaproteobacteria bacterium]|nr:SDR family oxidoreductase [Deltaproteobacteria bacterium]
MDDVFEKFSLRGRVAIVTGGAGLLGQEFCRTLAQAGARMVVADVNAQAATSVAGQLARDGLAAVPLATDITDPESVRRLIEGSLDAFGRLDILVNSAAVDPKFDDSQVGQHGSRFEDYPLTAWKQAVDVNLTGMFLCSQAAVRHMLAEKRGSIVNICSTYGLVGPDQRIYRIPGKPAQYKPVVYSVTKAGVLGLTRYLSTYCGEQGVRINALTPGGVHNAHDEHFVANYSARTVLGRMARRDEMNGALLFLASDASSYMTGANLVVDGGWTAW